MGKTATTTVDARAGRVGSRITRFGTAGLIGVASVLVMGAATGHPASAGPALLDTGSLSVIAQITGAEAMWDSGYIGQGVGVAVIDTGVAKVPGLDQPGKVVDGPDLSFDSQSPTLASTDGFGHGTHIAGIIAGSDVLPGATTKGCQTCTGKTAYSDTTKFVGIAPGASIVDVKVGAYDGAVDVSQVIAAIDWVVQHRNDPGMNIRVLNLSYGTNSGQAAAVDPLAYAVEQAWKAGIVVVAAGGNDGQTVGPLADPAYSPTVIAVGASDPLGTIDTRDDVIPSFAQHGTADRGVDVAAPGVSVTSLRVPNGFVDQNVTTGKVGTRFQRASGTSQSTAVISGLAALVLSKYPTATPDQVKAILRGSAVKMGDNKGNRYEFTGSGSANLQMVVDNTLAKLLGVVRNVLGVLIPTSTGTGSLELARGSYHLSANGVPLQGEIDIFGHLWSPTTMATATKLQSTWIGGTWNGSAWTGSAAVGGTWVATAWTNTDWTGARWSGARWSDNNWDGARWSGARWSGARWSDNSWDGARWSGARWSDNTWS